MHNACIGIRIVVLHIYRYARRNPIIQCALHTTTTYQSFLKVDQFEQSTTIGKPFAFLPSLKCIGN